MAVFGPWNLSDNGLADLSGELLIDYGAHIPPDGLANYEHGCLFISTGDGVIYRNAGTTEACRFVQETPAGSNAISYGAKGDGTTDDTAAIQSAIDSVEAAGGGVVVLPKGNYIVAGELTITSAAELSGIQAVITQTSEDKKTINVTGDNVTIRGIHFVGAGTEDHWASSNYSGITGVYINACENVRVTECRFTNHAGPDVAVYGACKNIDVSHNVMVGMGSPTIEADDNGVDGGVVTGGSVSTCNSISITHNQISDHAMGIILAFAVNSTAIDVSHNEIRDCPGQQGIYVSNGGQISISDNLVANAGKGGIKVQNTLDATDVDLPVRIAGNSVSGSGENGIQVTATHSNKGYYTNCQVTDNTIYDSTQDGLAVSYCKNAHITNNTIRTAGRNAILTAYVGGSIDGCTLSNSDQILLNCTNPTDTLRIENCKLLDGPRNASNSTAYTHRYMSYLTGTAASGEVYHVGNLTFEWENETPAANAPLYSLFAHSVTTVKRTGPINNLTTYAASCGGDDDSVAIESLTDAEAPNNAVYYSETQAKLCYKTSGGVVTALHA